MRSGRLPQRAALLVGVGLLLAACGSDDAGSEPGPGVTSSTPSTLLGPVPGTGRIDAFGIEQVWVPGGSFVMGTADPMALDPPEWAGPEPASEQPAHEVRITNGFWIDRHEVTNAAFAAFVDAGGYLERSLWSDNGWAWLSARQTPLPAACDGEEPEHPRACITWYEAEAYAAWRGGRLPTEAEWEYAARGPDSRMFPWGDEWDATRANLLDAGMAAAVGGYPAGASWVGALDMSGNVMEWVSDWWSAGSYAESPPVDPAGPGSGARKVEKGGWFGGVPYVGRGAYRHFEDPPTYQDHHIGVRIVTPG